MLRTPSLGAAHVGTRYCFVLKKMLASIIKEVELEVSPSSHELPRPLLLRKGQPASALSYGQEAGHEPERHVTHERLNILAAYCPRGGEEES